MKTFALYLVAVLAGVAASRPAFGASASPGANSAYASLDPAGVELALCAATPPPLLTASIKKGKKKNVLVIEAMLTSTPMPPDAINGVLTTNMRPTVNGVDVEPGKVSTSMSSLRCGFPVDLSPHGIGNTCTHTTLWWLDLDAAQLASPGSFIGKPLNVELFGCLGSADYVGSAPFTGSLVVRMQPK
jgi:hypothetical protein